MVGCKYSGICEHADLLSRQRRSNVLSLWPRPEALRPYCEDGERAEQGCNVYEFLAENPETRRAIAKHKPGRTIYRDGNETFFTAVSEMCEQVTEAPQADEDFTKTFCTKFGYNNFR